METMPVTALPLSKRFSFEGNENLLAVLVKTEKDAVVLEELISESHGKIALALLQLREKKIKEECISQKEFMANFLRDKKKALEELFLHPIEEWHVNRLDKLLYKNSLTLDDLYNELKNTQKNLGLLLH